MPEAAVDEDCELGLWKEKVWAAQYVLRTDFPAPDSVFDQECSEAQLRGHVRARLDRLHVPASLCCGFGVHGIFKAG